MAETKPLVLVDEPHAKDQREDADRHVDEEDPVPADPLGQESAGKQTQRTAARDDKREDAHRLGALDRLLKLGDDDGDDHPRRERATKALEEPTDDEVIGALGEPAADRRHRKQEDAREEDLAAADQVAEATGNQEEASVRDQVRVDHPGQVGLGKTKVALHVGQRHVDDGGVDHDHQLPEADDDQRGPASEI